MNFLSLSLLLSGLGGVAFYFFGEAGAMSTNASMLLSFEALIVGAVLVRLNRGLPSIDWKMVDATPIERLLNRLEEAAKVYIIIVVACAVSICILLASIYVDKVTFAYKLTTSLFLSTTFGVLLGFVISRMTFVVWLDLDIVRLQRAVILASAKSQNSDKQIKAAEDKLTAINNARIRPL